MLSGLAFFLWEILNMDLQNVSQRIHMLPGAAAP